MILSSTTNATAASGSSNNSTNNSNAVRQNSNNRRYSNGSDGQQQQQSFLPNLYRGPQHKRELILDATAATTHDGADVISVGSSRSRSQIHRSNSASSMGVPRENEFNLGYGPSLVQKLFDAGSSGNRAAIKERSENPMKNNAASFARSAPRAGYLCKLDPTTREFTRHFFVLKPSTHLYYFSSPSDSQPLGCIDLDSSCDSKRLDIHELESCQDGRVRFEVVVNDTNEENDRNSEVSEKSRKPQNRILLEARSKIVCDEWMESLSIERLSHAKETIRQKMEKEERLQQNIDDLQNQISNLKTVIKEKDDKIIELEESQDRTEKISKAMEVLSRQLRTPPLNDNEGDNSSFAAVTEDDRLLESYKISLSETGFAALSNACYMMRENLRLISLEANSSLQEIHEAQEKYASVQKRMTKAEKLLTKLWEENCALREKIRQLKVHKKNLSKQVISLTESKKDLPKTSESIEKSTEITGGASTITADDCSRVPIPALSIKEQSLLQELEEHIATSMRLHKKLMSKNDSNLNESIETKARDESFIVPVKTSSESNQTITDVQNSNITTEEDVSNSIEELDNIAIEHVSVASTSLSPMRPRNILAELDTSGLTENDDILNKSKSSSKGQPSSKPPTLKNVPIDDVMRNSMVVFDDDEEEEQSFAPQMSTTSSLSSVTDNWKATSRIHTAEEMGNDGQIYHITFHSNKIGLQFHKISASSFVRGTLSHAMSLDRAREPDTRDLIDEPCTDIKGNSNFDFHDKLNAASPIDAVLVCGFRGFDATSNNRPKLGARLVGFDGMSIERGRWTFESVRNAIQSRGRPLTLSFRNDFLTADQRAVLERACADNDESMSNESRQNFSQKIVGDGLVNANGLPPLAQYSSRGVFRHTPNSDHSVSKQNINGYSFSEVGSGSILSATFAPLMAGLMTGLDQTHENYVDTQIPHYLKSTKSNPTSKPVSDFRSNLL